MRPLPILTAVLLTAATPVFAQVTVDLHALQALPANPAASRPAHAAPSVASHSSAHGQRKLVAVPPAPPAGGPAAPAVASREPPPATPPSATPPSATSPSASPPSAAAPPAVPPALPDQIPATASIAPIAPPPPAAGSQPPAAPPVSATAATAAAPTTSGLRLTFAPEQSDLSPESSTSIKQLTQAAPRSDETTFNVLAYAPGKADDPSTARRISLSRAMAVRSALVADGVPSARIFVRALGAQYGDGPPDRVDLSVMGANAPANTATAR